MAPIEEEEAKPEDGVPFFSLDEYLAIRNKDIEDLIREAPEDVIKQRYLKLQKKFETNNDQQAGEASTDQMRDALIKYERASKWDNRASYLPPMKHADFS